jgi:hypothetical protein
MGAPARPIAKSRADAEQGLAAGRRSRRVPTVKLKLTEIELFLLESAARDVGVDPNTFIRTLLNAHCQGRLCSQNTLEWIFEVFQPRENPKWTAEIRPRKVSR